jgi:hypothetical protein
MAFEFRPATRENVSLLIGIAGPSGSGKTYSALRMARGIAGEKPFAVIDTEAGRARHYADQFRFDHGDLRAPFRPDAYLDAIRAAEEAHYPVVVVDSFSHVHAGEGGVLDWQEEILDEMVARAQQRGQKRAEWELRESYKRSAWIEPKMSYKRMVQRLLQVRAHLILCLRAEDKIDFVKGEDGKTKAVPMETLAGFRGWIPICDKRLPFELTASVLMLPDRPGVAIPIKVQQQHREMLANDAPVNEETGQRLAAWAKGAPPVPVEAPAPTVLDQVRAELERRHPGNTDKAKQSRGLLVARAFGVDSWAAVQRMDPALQADGLARLRAIEDAA